MNGDSRSEALTRDALPLFGFTCAGASPLCPLVLVVPPSADCWEVAKKGCQILRQDNGAATVTPGDERA
jgi:hypothetical protein